MEQIWLKTNVAANRQHPNYTWYPSSFSFSRIRLQAATSSQLKVYNQRTLIRIKEAKCNKTCIIKRLFYACLKDCFETVGFETVASNNATSEALTIENKIDRYKT